VKHETRVPPARCVCGHELELATPLERLGTAADARPTPGSLTLCIGCGRCYQFGERLGLGRPVDPACLPNISAEQLAQIRGVQDLIRDTAARRMFDRSLPPGYIACCERAERRARDWLDGHEGRRDNVRLRLPDPGVLLVAPLEVLAPRIAATKSTRKLLAYLIQGEPDLTVFQLRVIAARLALDVETVPFSALGISVPQS
jgi:hypothetical protein